MSFIPKKEYDIVFDIFYNLARINPYFLYKKPLKILFCAGSDPYYQNNAEISRVNNLNYQKRWNCTPKRIIYDPILASESIRIADACVLHGNNHTLNTYPKKYHYQFYLAPGIPSKNNVNRKSRIESIPKEKEFLWFGGAGAIHKGLDLVIEYFQLHPNITLNIIGNIQAENDFWNCYRKEFTATFNIKYHGFLIPNSKEFYKVIRNVIALSSRE